MIISKIKIQSQSSNFSIVSSILFVSVLIKIQIRPPPCIWFLQDPCMLTSQLWDLEPSHVTTLRISLFRNKMELILVAHTLFQEWRKMVIQWLNLALSGQGSRSVCGQGTKIPQAMQRSQKIIVIIFKEFLLKKRGRIINVKCLLQ